MPFDPSAFTAIKAEDIESVANIKAELVAFYQPVTSEEMFAMERLALARHSLLRAYAIESGLINVGLEEALDYRGTPQVLNPELTEGAPPSRGQNHSFWIAAGFQRLCRNSEWQMFLRYQAQTERLYRRALDELNRVRSLRPAPAQSIDPAVDPAPGAEQPLPAAPVRHSRNRSIPEKPAAVLLDPAPLPERHRHSSRRRARHASRRASQDPVIARGHPNRPDLCAFTTLRE